MFTRFCISFDSFGPLNWALKLIVKCSRHIIYFKKWPLLSLNLSFKGKLYLLFMSPVNCETISNMSSFCAIPQTGEHSRRIEKINNFLKISIS